jgi:Lon protease-like protein
MKPYELPLFPLNTVLFPGQPLQLHIFEERYQRMIRLCLESHSPFGVVLIRKGPEALGPLAEPYRYGTTAVIAQVKELEDGRMNIATLGQERFHILSLDTASAPYLVGTVEAYPLTNTAPGALRDASHGLRLWVEQYLQVLVKAGGLQLHIEPLPEEPAQLGYLAAILLQVPPEMKQPYLETESALDLITVLLQAYRREMALLQALLAPSHQEAGSFSVN